MVQVRSDIEIGLYGTDDLLLSTVCACLMRKLKQGVAHILMFLVERNLHDLDMDRDR